MRFSKNLCCRHVPTQIFLAILAGFYSLYAATSTVPTVIEATKDLSVNEGVLCFVIKPCGKSYEQTPPLYSALKHKGDPLYKLVREKRLDDQELESIALNKKRVVQLYELKLLSFDVPFFTIKARVSHGMYIRSLVNDIAVRAGSCANTYTLERSTIGKFILEQATPLAEINTVEDINQLLLPVEKFIHV